MFSFILAPSENSIGNSNLAHGEGVSISGQDARSTPRAPGSRGLGERSQAHILQADGLMEAGIASKGNCNKCCGQDRTRNPQIPSPMFKPLSHAALQN
ncbi:hypothetical protein ElyMa_004757500 [Elysia marginata]|uniref:Uncharacterized protein n=1 Tax=Elysia marginata TaxID=1093978 RepID=A0AAV4IEY4_9GAST|nr:hypothetical protein ElyMa_004757500 [Elysia marginata]